MDTEKLEIILQRLTKDIKKTKTGMISRKRLLWLIAGALGVTSIGLFFFGISVPALFLASLGASSFLWSEFDSKSSDTRIERLQQEKQHLDNIKNGSFTIDKKDNANRKELVKEYKEERAEKEKKHSRWQKVFFVDYVLMGISTVITTITPYSAIVTLGLFGLGHVINNEVNKQAKEIEELNLKEVNVRRDMLLLGEPYEATSEATSQTSNTNENTNSQQNTRTAPATENNTTTENNPQDQVDEILNDIMSTPEFKSLISSMAQHNPTEEEIDIAVQAVVDIYSKRQANQSEKPKVNEK